MSGETPVLQLSKKVGLEWPAIRVAADATAARLEALHQALAKYTSEDANIVVFGSLGRGELTSGSDLDWVLLVDGFANPEYLDASLAIEEHLRSEDLKGPGAEATFGGLVFSHDLIHYIGGQEDTNANLTRRMLLLLESASIGRDDAYNRTINNILGRYVLEDFGWMHARNPWNVPRFLHNDIVRYWRTIAVDFAYKRRQRAGQGWALRTAKLRLSRKLMYAAGLLMCYSCALDPVINSIIPSEAERGAAQKIVAHLASYVFKTPLNVFAEFFLREESLVETAKKFFATYDQFLALLNEPSNRLRLDALPYNKVADDRVYQAVRVLGHEFRDALEAVFFNPDLPRMYNLTKTYGVF